jgi:hypothetical protein
MNPNNSFYSGGNTVPLPHFPNISSKDPAIRSITVRRPIHLQEFLTVQDKEDEVIDSAVASWALS